METRHNVWSRAAPSPRWPRSPCWASDCSREAATRAEGRERPVDPGEHAAPRSRTSLQATNAALQAFGLQRHESGDAGYAGGGDSGSTTRRAWAAAARRSSRSPATSLFDSGKATPVHRQEGTRSSRLHHQEQAFQPTTVRVIGHTDSGPDQEERRGGKRALRRPAGCRGGPPGEEGHLAQLDHHWSSGASEPKG